jgi:hypothetical protein
MELAEGQRVRIQVNYDGHCIGIYKGEIGVLAESGRPGKFDIILRAGEHAFTILPYGDILNLRESKDREVEWNFYSSSPVLFPITIEGGPDADKYSKLLGTNAAPIEG